jgi:hypothetical protein
MTCTYTRSATAAPCTTPEPVQDKTSPQSVEFDLTRYLLYERDRTSGLVIASSSSRCTSPFAKHRVPSMVACENWAPVRSRSRNCTPLTSAFWKSARVRLHRSNTTLWKSLNRNEVRSARHSDTVTSRSEPLIQCTPVSRDTANRTRSIPDFSTRRFARLLLSTRQSASVVCAKLVPDRSALRNRHCSNSTESADRPERSISKNPSRRKVASSSRS